MVLAGPPNIPATTVARPSPRRVRCRPGSAMKFLPVVEEMADMSPMCSIMAAMAMGAMTRMEVRSNLAMTNCCRPTKSALPTSVKST